MLKRLARSPRSTCDTFVWIPNHLIGAHVGLVGYGGSDWAGDAGIRKSLDRVGCVIVLNMPDDLQSEYVRKVDHSDDM